MNPTKLSAIATMFRSALSAEDVTSIGRKVGFTHRLRDVTPFRLACSLITAFASQKVETIADLQRGFNALTGNSVQYKPFHNQLAKQGFPRFMEGVHRKLLEETILKVLAPVQGSALEQFDDLIVQDGSSYAIAESLQEVFPGRFTTISPAAVELHATMSVFHDRVIRVSIAPDTQGERDFLPKPRELTRKLLLADRGYQDVEYCQDVQRAGGSFLIRYKTQINPTLTAARMAGKGGWNLGAKRFHRVPKFVGRTLQDVLSRLRKRDADFDVEWMRNGAPFRCRVVLLWNPQKKQHVCLVTNLGRPSFSVHAIARLYRLRWQIELIFKEWKSYANLHAFGTGKRQIVEGFIWAGLAAALLKRFFAHATEYASESTTISTRRTAMALTHHLPRLMVALLRGAHLLGPLQELLDFLQTNGQRAHPKRDKAKGRLQFGLRHAMLNTLGA